MHKISSQASGRYRVPTLAGVELNRIMNGQQGTEPRDTGKFFSPGRR